MTGLPEPRGTLHLPPGGRASLAKVLEAVHFPPDFFETVWSVDEYRPGKPGVLSGGLRFRVAGGVHYIPGWAIRIDGSASLTYTGDTAPSDEVCHLAEGSDLLLAEATLDEPERGPVKGHLTAAQAGDLAATAQVSRLMLTHFWFDVDRDAVARSAAERYSGPVVVATDGLVTEF